MKPSLALICALTFLLGFSQVSAASKSAKFTVQVKVVGTCDIKTTAMDFGTYKGASVSGSSSAQVKCTKGMTYSLSLDNGTALRTMSMTGSPTSKLTYQLGLSGAGADGRVYGVGKNGTQTIAIQGTIPADQNLAPGDYTDTVVMSVNY